MIPKKIIIVGGGTAGWMCASMLAKKWHAHAVQITLVESKKIGTIGVGEGSTPFLRQFFQSLNISEKEWMPACDATYKCGIAFPDWCGANAPKSYFHPFYSEIDSPLVNDFFNSCQQRREGYNSPCLPDDYFITAYLAQQNKAPYTPKNETLGVDYGYHFDAEKLGNFLSKYAQSLGVRHINDKVSAVKHLDNNIETISTEYHGILRGDLFIDCSGFNGLLIQKTLGETLTSYEKYLPNNRAVAIATQHDDTSQYGTYTLSKALESGWMWSIPLQSRIGNGYVYSSQYLSNEDAEQQLRKALDEYTAPALHLSWTPGRINQHWKGNCLAVGLSQGFLEPLEAPMLNLVQQTCEAYIEYSERFENNAETRSQFNHMINRFIDGTRDYLQAHYAVNSRNDSQYWIDNRNNTHQSTTLKSLINGWKSTESFDAVLARHCNELVYAKTSWYCLFSGMGHYHPHQKGELDLSNQKWQNAKNHCQNLADKFVNQSALFSPSLEYV